VTAFEISDQKKRRRRYTIDVVVQSESDHRSIKGKHSTQVTQKMRDKKAKKEKPIKQMKPPSKKNKQANNISSHSATSACSTSFVIFDVDIYFCFVSKK
jgi:hypothetical protein